MKKITAVFVVFSLLLSNLAPVYANPGGKWIRQAARGGKKTHSVSRRFQATQRLSKTAQRAARVRAEARLSLLGKNPSFKTLHTRALLGKTSFLPQAILEHAVPAERADLLRQAFPSAALEASPEQLQQAAAFWRADLQKQVKGFNAADKTSAYNALADAAALGLYGDADDAALLAHFYQAAAPTPLAPEAAAVFVRALLAKGDFKTLAEFFARENGVYGELQNGIAAYAQKHGLTVNIPFAPEVPHAANQTLQDELAEYGKPCQLAADPSETATVIWMTLAKKGPAPAVAAVRLEGDLQIPAFQTPENLQLAARDVSAGQTAGNISSAPADTTPAGTPVRSVAETSASTPEALPLKVNAWDKIKNIFSGKSAAPAAGTAVVAAPQAKRGSLKDAGKKAWGKIRSLFSKKPVQPAQPSSGSSALQRFGIYMASYVMGLEVATPVIANFGSSFGLSLEENILVAVATYLPYSLGAFLSNWTKKVLGRKNSMNLGLALMGGGFLTGVTLCGLNGAFLPQADTLMHFYKVLGCITVASLGGVLVHNSVGPMMTELNADASDLVRQKRNAYTELSRALGMASSFAFPFLATKVLGMDWSLTFALPIPLVAAAAAGINLTKLPNTKPLADAPKTKGVKATGLINVLKNNDYIRLFKEEKGVGAFLGGLFIMNAVELAINSGFLFLLPSMTADPSSQYLFGLAQFAAPFLLGRYLAGKFLQWFPKHNMSIATLLAAGGGLASLGALDNVYALTAALFLAETGISTGFTLGFARTAKNPKTQDRVVSLIVASALSCAFGPLLLTKLAQTMIDAGLLSAETATAAAMIGIPAGLAVLSAMLFRHVENLGEATSSVLKKIYSFIKKSVYHPKQRRKRS